MFSLDFTKFKKNLLSACDETSAETVALYYADKKAQEGASLLRVLENMNFLMMAKTPEEVNAHLTLDEILECFEYQDEFEERYESQTGMYFCQKAFDVLKGARNYRKRRIL